MSRDAEALRAAIEAVEGLGPLDAVATATTTARLDALTKPPGSLGRLEALAIQLAGISGDPSATYRRRAIVVAAADHGVVGQGVSAYPAEVTAQMVANFMAGGAAINALAELARASVTVIDAGIASSVSAAGTQSRSSARLVRAPVRPGTDDMTVGPAMSRADARRAIATGLEVAASLRREGIELIGIGEMGIGNSTAASAITAALTGLPPERVTGRGTGVDDETHARKIAVVRRALDRHRLDATDPLGVLASVGGLEIGALVGVVLGAVGARIPVVLDGFITGSAALLAVGFAPAAADRLIAGHRSVEPGHGIVLDRLGLRPLLELDLRLGEGTGAALAMTLVDAAVAVRDGMATFGSAGVSGASVRAADADIAGRQAR